MMKKVILQINDRFKTCAWLIILLVTGCSNNDNKIWEAGADWPVYQGGKSSNQYSPLKQITPENVQFLEPVWEYHSEGR